MKANRWANPYPYPKYIPDNLPGPYTLSEHSYKTRAAVPWCYPGSRYNPTVRINLININLKRAYRVIHNFIYLIIILHYKYRYNILYMQINIDGPHKAQGHNPKGH